MKAIVVDEPGVPDVLRLEEVEKPEPGPGEVLIGVAVAGVNFADVGLRAGMRGGPHALELPYTPGFEVAGVAATVGEGAEGVAGGDRVAAVLQVGGYAEYAVAPAEGVVRIPDGVGFDDASALLVQGLTAYGVLHDSARVEEGDAVLVMAAGGGVGTLAVQLAKLAGAGTVVGRPGAEESWISPSPSAPTAPSTTRRRTGSMGSWRRPAVEARMRCSSASAATWGRGPTSASPRWAGS
jgi:NADPH2:quinone reductase